MMLSALAAGWSRRSAEDGPADLVTRCPDHEVSVIIGVAAGPVMQEFPPPLFVLFLFDIIK